MKCFFAKRFLLPILGMFLMQNKINASQPAAAAAVVQEIQTCTVELHLENQVHQAIQAQLHDVPVPLIDLIKLYIAFSHKWAQGRTLDLKGNHECTIKGMFAIPPHNLAVSYARELRGMNDVAEPIMYSKLWDLQAGTAVDFVPAAFIDGATLAHGRVGVLVEDSIQVPLVDLTIRRVVDNVRCGLNRKHRFTALSAALMGHQLVGGMLNGDVYAVQFEPHNQAPVLLPAEPADQNHDEELIPYNAITALCALPGNRVAVGKKRGQLRIADLAAKTWSEELSEPNAQRTTIQKMAAWPNNILATLKGHPHGEKTVQIWDVSGTGVFTRTLPIEKADELNDMVALPHNNLAVACGSTIEIIDIRMPQRDAKSREENALKNAARVTCLASPHGNQLAAGLSNGRIQLWNRVNCTVCAARNQ